MHADCLEVQEYSTFHWDEAGTFSFVMYDLSVENLHFQGRSYGLEWQCNLMLRVTLEQVAMSTNENVTTTRDSLS